MSPALFAAAVRARLMAPHPRARTLATCPGCPGSLYEPVHLQRHVLGCAACPKANATTRHNRCVRFLYDLCERAGLPSVIEPRGFSTYTCPKCHVRGIAPDEERAHGRRCGVNLLRSGPDLYVSHGGGECAPSEVYYDFTVIQTTAQSYERTATQRLLAEVIKEKEERYVTSGMIAKENFVVLPVTALGHLSPPVVRLLSFLADIIGDDREDVLDEFAAQGLECMKNPNVMRP